MISDELLRQAALEAEDAILAGLPKEDSHSFSPRFERRMTRLLRRARHSTAYRFLSRAAGILLAVLLTGLVWLSFDTQARNAVFTWLREAYESIFVYRFQGEETPQTQSYRPSWLPEGYAEAEFWDDETNFMVIYEIDSGDLLFFQYMFGSEGTALYVLEETEPVPVRVHQFPADFYPAQADGENSTLVWIDPNADILFSISANLTSEELVKIAESIKKQSIF